MPSDTLARRPRASPEPIASWTHLAGYLILISAVVAWGFHAQQSGGAPAGPAAPGPLAARGAAIRFYLASIIGDCLLCYYCWGGVHRRGGNLATLTGGRWTSWRAVALDISIALPFWILWEATAWAVHGLLGAGAGNASAILLPQTPLEATVWIVVSIVAGFTEEIQSRGYLQRQFHALSGSVLAAVFGQAVIFGLMHLYQGIRQVIVIAVLGVLYGGLAAWRGNLRANMLAHAWSDIWEGWLKSFV